MKICKKEFVNVVFGTLLFGLFPMIAFGAITFDPAGPEASAYLNSNSIEIVDHLGDYLKLVDPNSLTCEVETDFDPTDALFWGSTGNLDFYINFWGCTAFDYTVDGDWQVSTYSDSGFTTLVDGPITFCQGSGCTPPPPGPTPTSTAEMIDIHYDLLWMLWFLVFACSFLWFERYYKT